MCACQGALVVYTVRQKRIAKEHCNAFLVRPKGFEILAFRVGELRQGCTIRGGQETLSGGEKGAADGIGRLFGILYCVCAGAYAGGTVCKCYTVGRYDLCAGFQHKFGFGVGRNGEGHIRLDGVLFPAQGVAA